jgi:predicted enzyme related to lactoylglutathione lyase
MSIEGRFVHLELLSGDLGRAVPFLTGLLQLEVVAEEEPTPLLALAPHGVEESVIGLAALAADQDVASHWVVHAAVVAPREVAARAAAEGGAIHMSPDMIREVPDGLSPDEIGAPPEVADTCLIGDPHGAILALVALDAGFGPPPAAVGAPAWFELLTSDVAEAAAFYAALGWDIGPLEERLGDGLTASCSAGGVRLGQIRALPPGAPMSPLWLPFLRVAELDRALARVRGLGGFHFEDAATVPGGRRAIVIEPSGALVGLWQPA